MLMEKLEGGVIFQLCKYIKNISFRQEGAKTFGVFFYIVYCIITAFLYM